MAKRKQDVIQRFIKQIERNTNKLKKDLKRFSKNNNLPHNLDELAGELRRGAASVASEVEHYLHEITSGSATTAKKRPAAKKATRKTAKRATRKTTKKAARKKSTRKTAKKATRKTAKKTARKKTRKTRR